MPRTPTCARGVCSKPLALCVLLSPRFGVADHALDRWEAAAQAGLDAVHEVMNFGDGAPRFDIAVEVYDFAVGGVAHPHIMDIAQHRAGGRQFAERRRDGARTDDAP